MRLQVGEPSTHPLWDYTDFPAAAVNWGSVNSHISHLMLCRWASVFVKEAESGLRKRHSGMHRETSLKLFLSQSHERTFYWHVRK